MRATFRIVLFTFALQQAAGQGLSYRNQSPVIEKTNEYIEIDGQLNEDIWQNLTPFRFIQFRPDWGKEDSLTQLFVTFDDDHLYIGAQCLYPEPDKIVARNLVRDGWKGDDWFTFHIDSYGDQQNALVFSIYPLNSRLDIATSNDGIPLGNSTFNSTYDMIWEGKTTVSEEGWFIEMKIPLSNLRFRFTKDGRIHSAISAARSIMNKNEVYIFPSVPQDVQNPVMRPSVKQPVVFEELKPRKQLLVTPYLLAGLDRQSTENDSGTEYVEESKLTREAGLDVRYGISPKLTLDLTYNTDFSQVEADDQVVNLSRFSIFFPEKRRFFQEQAGLYEVNLGGSSQLFYSRNIGIRQGQLTPVLGGSRLNGKVGNWDIGSLFLRTQETTIPSGESITSENFAVSRLRRKVINDRSFIGLMGTLRNETGHSNVAASFDGLINLKNDIYWVSSLAYSYDDSDEDHDILNHTQLYTELQNRSNAGWIYNVTYNYSGPDFNPGLGFLARRDFHNPFISLAHGKYHERGSGMWQYVKWTFLASDQYWSASERNFETWYSFTGLELTNFHGDSFDFSHVRELQHLQDNLQFTNELKVAPGEYFFHYAFIGFYPAPQRKFNHWTRLLAGSFYGGSRLSLTYSPSFNINKHFNLSGQWLMNYLDLDQASWVHVARLTLEMAANLHLSGSATIQYNTATQSLFNNARLRYNFRDGHDIYLVYNETFQTDRRGLDPIPPLSAQQTLALKYIYTFYR